MKNHIVLLISTLLVLSTPAYGTIGIDVTPGSWDIGAVPEGSVQTTWTASTPDLGGYFMVTHIGTDSWESVSIRCDNTAVWTAGGAQADDVFTLGWGQTALMGTMPAFVQIQNSDSILVESLGTGLDFMFDLEFGLPVPSSTTSQQQIVVTLTASTPVGFIYCLSGDFWAKDYGSGYCSTGQDWALPGHHELTQTEWEFMVLDGILPVDSTGWIHPNTVSCFYWKVISTNPPGTWPFSQHAQGSYSRWVVLD